MYITIQDTDTEQIVYLNEVEGVGMAIAELRERITVPLHELNFDVIKLNKNQYNLLQSIMQDAILGGMAKDAIELVNIIKTNLTDAEKDALDSLIDHTIGPSITEDLGIEIGSDKEEDAFNYLIHKLEQQRDNL